MSAKKLMLLSVILFCATWVVAQAAPGGGAGSAGGAGSPGGSATPGQTSPSTPPTGNTGTPPTGSTAQPPTGSTVPNTEPGANPSNPNGSSQPSTTNPNNPNPSTSPNANPTNPGSPSNPGASPNGGTNPGTTNPESEQILDRRILALRTPARIREHRTPVPTLAPPAPAALRLPVPADKSEKVFNIPAICEPRVGLAFCWGKNPITSNMRSRFAPKKKWPGLETRTTIPKQFQDIFSACPLRDRVHPALHFL